MTRIPLIIACLLTGTSAAPAQDAPDDPRLRARQLLTDADEANNRDQLREAVTQLQPLIAAADALSAARAQSLLAEVYLESGHFDQATRAAESARRVLLDPRWGQTRALMQYRQDVCRRSADIHLELARIAQDAQDPVAAENHLRRAADFLRQALNIRGGHELLKPAWKLTRLERLAELRTRLNQPTRAADAWDELAQLARKLRDDHRPRPAEEKTIEPDEEFVAAVRALGRYHAARGETTAAIDVLTDVIDQPIEAELKVVLLSDIAEFWGNQKDYRQEIAWLKQAIDLAIARTEPNDHRLANLNGRRGAALDALQQESAAEEFWYAAAFHLQCAIETARLEGTKDPERATAEVMLDMQKLQDVYQRLDKFDDALAVAIDLRDLRRARYLNDDPRIFHSQSKIGAYLAKLARNDKAKLDTALVPLAEADAYWRQRKPAEPDVHARTLNVLAGVYRRQGKLPQADELLTFAHETYPAERISVPVRISLAISRGLILSAQGKYKQAIDEYETAERLAAGHERSIHELKASALLNLAMVYKSQLQFARAREYCQRGLDERLKVLEADDPRMLPHYLALGGLEVSAALTGTRGLKDAIADLTKTTDRCESICRTAGWFSNPNDQVGMLLHQRAMIHYLKDRLTASAAERRQAREIWKQALPVHDHTGRPAEVARTHYYLAKLSLSDWQEAMIDWQQQQRDQAEYARQMATFEADVEQYKMDMEQYIKDEQRFDNELRSYKSAIDRNEAKPEVHERLTQQRQSLLKSQEQFDSRHENLGKERERLNGQYNKLDNTDRQQRDVLAQLLTAQTEARQAVTLLESIGAYPNLHYTALCTQADILLKLSQLSPEAAAAEAEQYARAAITALQHAAELTETPRSMVTGGDIARAEFFSNYVTAFDQLVRLHAERGEYVEALFYAEKGRNRTFLDQLRAAEIDVRQTLPVDKKPLLDDEVKLLTRHADALARADTIAREAAGTDDPDKKQALQARQRLAAAELKQIRSDYATLLGRIYDASPKYGRLLKSTASQADLQATLDRLAGHRGPILYYYVGRDRSHLFLIGADGAAIQHFLLRAPHAAEVETIGATDRVSAELLKREVEDYRARLSDAGRAKTLTQRGTEEAPNVTIATGRPTITHVELTEMVLPSEVRQIVIDLAPEYVAVVPDGALHHLPLEALKTKPAPNAQFLLDDFPPIAYAPSINILQALVETAPNRGVAPAALTVGNPKFASSDDEAPAAELPSSDSDPPRFVTSGMRLTPLPDAQREAELVSDTLKAAFGDHNVELLILEDATEGEFRRQLAKLSPLFVHLATHGLVDDSNYNLFGSIALAEPTAGTFDPEDDGFLALHEIHALPLGGCELVVLSACQTNVGPVRPLESGATMARAFLSAGARRVISSQWKVADESTAEMISAYFQRIAADVGDRSPVNYAVALQAARKQLRQHPTWNSPYHWAPFVLIGPAEGR